MRGVLSGMVPAVLVACTGGGGDIAEEEVRHEGPPSFLEQTEKTREQAPSFREVPSPNAESGGGRVGFTCSGTYVCVQSGEPRTSSLTLSTVNGECTIQGEEGVSIILTSNGRITLRGEDLGRWSRSGAGFTVTTEDGSTTCQPG